MNDWYRVIFSADEIAGAKHLEMVGHFERFFFAAGSPQDATLFRVMPPNQGTYYFSPGAAKIATKLINHLSATSCPPPEMAELEYVAGYQEVRS